VNEKEYHDLIRRLQSDAIPPDPELRAFFYGASAVGTWQSLKLNELSDWVERFVQGDVPPIYKLADVAPELNLATPPGAASFESFQPPQAERRADSGIWSVRIAMDRRPEFEGVQADLLGNVSAAAQRLDGRELVRATQPRSEVVKVSARSRLPEHDLPVLGPGGRLIGYALGSVMQFEIVIRKRETKIVSQWRGGAEIVEGIQRRISALGIDRAAADLVGSLGYFELSKYERQTHMRPVFVLHLDFQSPNDSTPLWRSTVVEPATTAIGVSLGDGMGSWAV